MNNISFEKVGLAVTTHGLVDMGVPEIRVQVNVPELLGECEAFLQFIANYVRGSNVRIRPGETMNYGYWLVKFQSVGSNMLEVWEYNSEGTEFVLGASLALSYWRDQHEVCSKYQADFSPPRPDKLTSVSIGVLEGLPVEAVRYPMQEHMSGWFLFTDKWDKNVKSLANEHTYHITAARPDLARFLALPTGFRFDLRSGKRVWLDEEVAHEPIV